MQVGDQVPKGTELASVVRAIDYEQRIQQAQAQVAQADAQLAQAQANLRESEIEYTRAKTLFDSASLVKPQYARLRAKGRFESAQASVEGAARAAIANARTVVDQTKLGLSEHHIVRAPFTGWITARNILAGSLVANSTVGFSMMDTHLVVPSSPSPTVSLEKRSGLAQRQTILLDAVPHPLQGVVHFQFLRRPIQKAVSSSSNSLLIIRRKKFGPG